MAGILMANPLGTAYAPRGGSQLGLCPVLPSTGRPLTHTASSVSQTVSQQTQAEHPPCTGGTVLGAGGGKVNKSAGPQIPNQQQPCRLLTQQTPRIGTVAKATHPVPVPCQVLHCDIFSPPLVL